MTGKGAPEATESNIIAQIQGRIVIFAFWKNQKMISGSPNLIEDRSAVPLPKSTDASKIKG